MALSCSARGSQGSVIGSLSDGYDHVLIATYNGCIHNLYVYMAPSMYMDEQTMWIERLDDRTLFRLNDIMGEESLRQGYYPGKLETRWFKLFEAIVEECVLRNKARWDRDE